MAAGIKILGKKYDAKKETTANMTHCKIVTSCTPEYHTYSPVINAAVEIARP